MNAFYTRIRFSICLGKSRNYGKKLRWQVLKRNTEVYEMATDKPKSNLLSVFGVAGTGALGIRKLINDERIKGNLVVARRPYPLYYFNVTHDIPRFSIKYVSAGYGFTLFSGKSSKVGWRLFGCGLNTHSQLGLQKSAVNKNGYPIVMVPQIINLPSEFKKINHIGSGRSHSVVVGEIDTVDSDSQLIYLFGDNRFGQCGREIIDNEIYADSAVIHGRTFPKRIKQVECGELNTFLLAEDGSVYGCGLNNHGQLANEQVTRSSSFIQISGGLENNVVTQISCRCNTVLALTANGEVWAWGNNEYGTIIGENDHSSVMVPKRIEMPNTVSKVIQVSSGNSVGAVLDDRGQVHTWGMTYIGHGPSVQMVGYPKLINPNLFGGGLAAFDKEASKIIDIACGVNHCVAITSSGSVYVWGWDCVLKKQIQTFPTRMSITFNGKKAFIGADHTIVMGGHVV